MKADRRAMPSYPYVPPRPPADHGAMLTAATLWGGLAFVGAIELYLAFAFVPGAQP